MLMAAVMCATVHGLAGPGTGAGEKVVFAVDPDQSLSVQAYWDPIEDTEYRVHEQDAVLDAMINSGPAEPSREYSAEAWRGWLPDHEVAVGDTWPLGQESVLEVMRQFHPSPTFRLHHSTGTSGGHAILRALSAEFAEIVFRAHVEFRQGSTFMTPAQYTGHLVWDRELNAPWSFHLYLPPRNTNVDVNASHQADIGFIPRMELIGGEARPDDYTEALTEAEAQDRLARLFYASSSLDWLPLEQAVQRCQDEGKSLHAVILFGTLDDESC